MKERKGADQAKEFNCQQCGECCLKYGHSMQATQKDIDTWEANQRNDILKYTKIIRIETGAVASCDLWFNPRTGKNVTRCPWLRWDWKKKHYVCRIYDVRPEVCRNYPLSVGQAKKDGCHGYKTNTA